MTYTEEQLIEAYEKLPEDIREAIANAETEKKIALIGERHNLHIDQIGELADETGLVMLGLKQPNQFVANLSERLGLAEHEAEIIAQEVNTEVLANIRETIKRMAEGELTEVPPPAFQQKVGQIFTATAEQATKAPPLKPWEGDPYLERP